MGEHTFFPPILDGEQCPITPNSDTPDNTSLNETPSDMFEVIKSKSFQLKHVNSVDKVKDKTDHHLGIQPYNFIIQSHNRRQVQDMADGELLSALKKTLDRMNDATGLSSDDDDNDVAGDGEEWWGGSNIVIKLITIQGNKYYSDVVLPAC